MARLITVCRPEAGGIRCQHLITENDLSVFVQSEFKLGIRDDDPLGQRVICALLIQSNGVVAKLLRILLSLAREFLLQHFHGTLERNILIMITDLCLGRRCINGFRQLVGFDQAFRKGDAADGTIFLVAGPAGACDITADDALDRKHGQLPAHHGIAVKLRLLKEFRHILYICRDHMVRQDIAGHIKPEPGHLCEHGSLLVDLILQDHVIAADTVSCHHDQAVAVVVDLTYLTLFDRFHFHDINPPYDSHFAAFRFSWILT